MITTSHTPASLDTLMATLAATESGTRQGAQAVCATLAALRQAYAVRDAR